MCDCRQTTAKVRGKFNSHRLWKLKKKKKNKSSRKSLRSRTWQQSGPNLVSVSTQLCDILQIVYRQQLKSTFFSSYYKDVWCSFTMPCHAALCNVFRADKSVRAYVRFDITASKKLRRILSHHLKWRNRKKEFNIEQTVKEIKWIRESLRIRPHFICCRIDMFHNFEIK